MANTKYFNGVELGALGLQVGGISGVHDLLPMETARTWIPGRDYPSDVETHRTLGKVALRCVVAEDTHALLVAKLQTLRGYMDPGLGWCALTLSERPGERCLARSMGFGVNIDDIPWDRNVIEWTWTLERYGWWEDATARTATIDTQLLAFRQATFEHTVMGDCGWHTLDGGTPTLSTTDPYAGDSCMQVVTTGGAGDGVKTPEAGIAGITAAETYSLGVWLKGAAGGETVTLALRFFTAADAFISEATANVTLTAAWAQYKLEAAAAPALATKASIQLRDPDATTFYADQVSLTRADTVPTSFITPYDANTFLGNEGAMVALPTYTCTATAALASGLTFTVGSQVFTYSGALAPADVLVVETDVPDVELNGTRDFANVAAAAEFPTLAAGHNTVTAKTTGFVLGVSWRVRNP